MDLKKYKLGDVGKIITGKTPPTNNSNNYGGEIPFLTPSDDLSTVYVESTAKMLSNLGVRSVKKCLLPPRSVCVSCIGSDLGRVILTKVETVTNQQFNAIIPHSEFNSEYLYYYLTSLEKYLLLSGKKRQNHIFSTNIISYTCFTKKGLSFEAM